jgi:hypothetical protein
MGFRDEGTRWDVILVKLRTACLTMKAPTGQHAAVLHKIIRLKNGSDGKSLFGLLISIEQKIAKRVRRNEQRRVAAHQALKPVSQRPRAILKLSRYVE